MPSESQHQYLRDGNTINVINSSTHNMGTIGGQYTHVYFCRLQSLKGSIQQEAMKKWNRKINTGNEPVFVDRLLDLEHNRDSILIGVIYAQLSAKPCILKDLEGDLGFPDYIIPLKYTGSGDEYFLEDESGRVELLISDVVKKHIGPALITGTCVALRGREDSSGKFDVADFCLAGCPPSLNPRIIPDGRKYIALISGLEYLHGKEHADSLFDYLMGNMSSNNIQPQSISSCLFVGNTFGKIGLSESSTRRKYGNEGTKYDLDGVKLLDERLACLLGSSSVILVPGASDPTNNSLPQRALKSGLLPLCSSTGALVQTDNPSFIDIDGTNILVMSGQNIDDMSRYLETPDPLEIARINILSRHLAPCAPDTLWCQPFSESDPFVLEHSPHLYVIGNQSEFLETTVNGADGSVVKIVLIPKYFETKTIVLMDLTSLECHSIKLF